MSYRSIGILKAVVGGIFTYFILSWVMSGNQPSASGGGFKLILLSLPIVVTLTGILEFFSNRSFMEFSDAWDELAGWQRGILGIMIVIFSFMLMMAMVALFA